MPTPSQLAVTLCLLALPLLAWATPPRAATSSPSCDSATEVEAAILVLTESAPNHPVQRRADYRRELAGAISWAASARGVDAGLLTAVVFAESSFRLGLRGARGEVGLLQVHGVAAEGCDLDSISGQVDCGAAWLGRGLRRCVSEAGALRWYSRGTCEGGPVRIADLVAHRQKLADTARRACAAARSAQ